MEGDDFDDVVNQLGQRLHFYANGGGPDPMAVANGSPNDVKGTQTAWLAGAFNFNVNREDGVSGLYDGGLEIDCYMRGAPLPSVRGDDYGPPGGVSNAARAWLYLLQQ